MVHEPSGTRDAGLGGPGGPGRTRRRLAALVTAAALVVTGAGLTYASAASLAVTGGTLSTAAASHPCPGPVAATPGPVTSAGTATSVVLTLPAACAAAPGTLRLVGPAGAGDVAFTATGTTTTVAVPSYSAAQVTGIAVTLRTWGSVATWSYTPTGPGPLVSCRVVNHPAATCGVVVDTLNVWGWPTATHFQIDARVIGQHNAQGQVWELTFDFSSASSPFVPRGVTSNGGLVLQSGCASMPVMTVRGNPGWAGPHDEIRQGQTRSVYLQGYLNQGGNLLTCP